VVEKGLLLKLSTHKLSDKKRGREIEVEEVQEEEMGPLTLI
jgi:hypothetical protein